MPFSGATAIDLSRLPFPAVIEALDYASILAANKAELVAAMPHIEAALELQSEPLAKLVQHFSYRELILRARGNDFARALFVAHATGSNLDNLVALLGVARLVLVPADPIAGTPAVMESDADLRERAVLAPEGFSVAGPVGAYVFHARSAHPEVLDADAFSPTPGQVRVAVLSRIGTGTPSAPVLAAVTAALNAEDVRPLTDQVVIQAATILPFQVIANIDFLQGPDTAVVLATALARLGDYVVRRRRLGQLTSRAGLISALYVEGTANLTLTSPAADIPAGPGEAPSCTLIRLNGVDYPVPVA